MNVIIHYPETEEDLNDLEHRIAQMKAAVILHRIDDIKLPDEKKEELISLVLKLLKAEAQ